MDWLDQGSVQRSDMQDLPQQVENVKQLAQSLSRRSDASRNQSGAPGERLTDSRPGVRASSRQRPILPAPEERRGRAAPGDCVVAGKLPFRPVPATGSTLSLSHQ